MDEERFSDKFLQANLSEHGDPTSFFVVQDCIINLDDQGHAWALLIEQEDLAEAMTGYLKRLGQIREKLPDEIGDNLIKELP